MYVVMPLEPSLLLVKALLPLNVVFPLEPSLLVVKALLPLYVVIALEPSLFVVNALFPLRVVVELDPSDPYLYVWAKTAADVTLTIPKTRRLLRKFITIPFPFLD